MADNEQQRDVVIETTTSLLRLYAVSEPLTDVVASCSRRRRQPCRSVRAAVAFAAVYPFSLAAL